MMVVGNLILPEITDVIFVLSKAAIYVGPFMLALYMTRMRVRFVYVVAVVCSLAVALSQAHAYVFSTANDVAWEVSR